MVHLLVSSLIKLTEASASGVQTVFCFHCSKHVKHVMFNAAPVCDTVKKTVPAACHGAKLILRRQSCRNSMNQLKTAAMHFVKNHALPDNHAELRIAHCRDSLVVTHHTCS